MREIKFRAWDKRFKKMDFGVGSLLLRINETDFYEPQEFTGITDVNNTEIYEGDIFLAKMTNTDKGCYVKVVFDQGSFQVEAKNGMRCWNDYLVMTRGEILGNIYENPELLTN